MKTLRSRHARRVLAPVMAVTLLSACSIWEVQDIEPAQVVSEKVPGKIRLTMLNGDRMELGDPIVSDGEIVGHPVRRDGAYRWIVRSDTVRVVADSVARIEVRETDVASTVVVTVVFGLVVAAFAALMIVCQDGCW